MKINLNPLLPITWKHIAAVSGTITLTSCVAFRVIFQNTSEANKKKYAQSLKNNDLKTQRDTIHTILKDSHTILSFWGTHIARIIGVSFVTFSVAVAYGLVNKSIHWYQTK